VAKWFREFRECDEVFINPHILFETAFPTLLEEKRKEEGLDEQQYSMEDMLSEYRLSKLDLSTICRWMERLGFKYEARKKKYYTDNHDTEENILYRNKFIERYLKYERRCFRFIQLSYQYLQQISGEGREEDGKASAEELVEMGYKFFCHEKRQWMYEYHVDDHPTFGEMANKTRFGGWLSVRKPAHLKPIIIFGQDECIFKQYAFTKKAWLSPSGKSAMMPKDEGLGEMISAFVSREFGYSYELTQEELKKVNEYRKNKRYQDEKAAVMVLGSAEKQKTKITSTPFEVKIEYGSQLEGYWIYERMVIQLEDTIDVLRALFQDQYELVFLFDHSNGHDRQRPWSL
jgi:hypothetical protein